MSKSISIEKLIAGAIVAGEIALLINRARRGRLSTFNSLIRLSSGFWAGFMGASKNTAKHDKKIHDNLSEKQLDKMLKDSFPASDAPSTY